MRELFIVKLKPQEFEALLSPVLAQDGGNPELGEGDIIKTTREIGEYKANSYLVIDDVDADMEFFTSQDAVQYLEFFSLQLGQSVERLLAQNIVRLVDQIGDSYHPESPLLQPVTLQSPSCPSATWHKIRNLTKKQKNYVDGGTILLSGVAIVLMALYLADAPTLLFLLPLGANLLKNFMIDPIIPTRKEACAHVLMGIGKLIIPSLSMLLFMRLADEHSRDVKAGTFALLIGLLWIFQLVDRNLLNDEPETKLPVYDGEKDPHDLISRDRDDEYTYLGDEGYGVYGDASTPSSRQSASGQRVSGGNRLIGLSPRNSGARELPPPITRSQTPANALTGRLAPDSPINTGAAAPAVSAEDREKQSQKDWLPPPAAL